LHTELGKLLDPIADKFLLITSFIVYMHIDWVPIWFTITVLSRDLFIVIGWILMYLIFDTTKVQPSPIGKWAVAMQMTLVGYILLENTLSFNSLLYEIMIWITVILTVASGLQYIYKGLTYTNE
jgi:cardiolipin synthase